MTLSENNQKDILAYIMLFLFILVALYFTTSCSPCNYVSKHPECFPADTVLIEKTIIQRDSFSYVEPDSLSLSLLFECDSNNNVLIKELSDAKSKGFITKYIFKDNRLNLTAYIDSIAILNKIIETTKSKEIIKVNPLNEQLKKDNDKLTQRNETKTKVIIGLIAAILLMSLLYKIFK